MSISRYFLRLWDDFNLLQIICTRSRTVACAADKLIPQQQYLPWRIHADLDLDAVQLANVDGDAITQQVLEQRCGIDTRVNAQLDLVAFVAGEN
jgi:hypothetical protein